MSTTKMVKRIPFSLKDLNSDMAARVQRLLTITNELWFTISDDEVARFEPFEGFRSEERQEYLLTVSKTTMVGPGQSAHQYGLAVDFAVRVYAIDDARKVVADTPCVWSWSQRAPWAKLKAAARLVGLDVPIAWDLGHVSYSDWRSQIVT